MHTGAGEAAVVEWHSDIGGRCRILLLARQLQRGFVYAWSLYEYLVEVYKNEDVTP